MRLDNDHIFWLSRRMTLAKFLEKEGLTQAAFGRRVGMTQQVVSAWVAGILIPRRRAMERIVEATKGAVTPNDFLRSTPAASQPAMVPAPPREAAQ